MSVRLLESLIPFLALAFAASALFRLARVRFPRRAAGLWALPKGPSIVMASVEGLTALFLMITTTLIWGLFLVTVLVLAHAAALWKAWPSDPVQT
ncbi:MAG TPA: hypothetical protein VH019_07400 [Rhizomicrobium sp.]|jgi:hypothetical protein|nr:hypothetical protein [Rhizomicrobium sp.]